MALEQYLEHGYVRFGSIGERFFRASYADLFHNVVIVESQLGAMHLMHQLEVEILKEIKKDLKAVRAFEKENTGLAPSSFPVGDKCLELDRLLMGQAFILGVSRGGVVGVSVYQTNYREPNRNKNKKASPGIYIRRGFGSSFLEAVCRASTDTDPSPLDFFSELPDHLCVNRS